VGRIRLLILLACLGCVSAPRRSPAGDERSIAAALDDFHDAAARADEDRYFAHFAPSGIFLGTDATERWDVAAFRAFAHPFFARGKAWAFRAARRVIVVRGDTAWFDEDLVTDTLGPARGSGVLVLRDGRWLLEQYVLSITVPNERFPGVRELLERSR
jgi:ketosteroid isomerase-like protein